MSRDLEIYNQLRAYLQDGLGEEEKIAFAEQLQSPEAQEWLRVHGAIEAAGDQYYQEMFKSLHKEMKPKQKRRKILFWTSIAAAAIIGLFLLVQGDFLPFLNKSSEDLFTQHYKTPGAIERDLETEILSPQEVIQLLEPKAERTPLEDRSLGIAYMETKEYEKAISSLDNITYDTFMKDEALWYQALAALKLERIDSTKSFLKELIDKEENANSSHRPKAIQLLKDIENL